MQALIGAAELAEASKAKVLLLLRLLSVKERYGQLASVLSHLGEEGSCWTLPSALGVQAAVKHTLCSDILTLMKFQVQFGHCFTAGRHTIRTVFSSLTLSHLMYLDSTVFWAGSQNMLYSNHHCRTFKRYSNENNGNDRDPAKSKCILKNEPWKASITLKGAITCKACPESAFNYFSVSVLKRRLTSKDVS